MLVVSVYVVYHMLHFLVVLCRILEREVATPWKNQVLGAMDWVYEFMDVFDELYHFLFCVECFESLINLEGVFIVHLEVGDPAVVVSEYTCQDLLLGTKMAS